MGDALGTAEYTSWCPISEVGKKGCRWELTPTPERCWWCLCIHLFFSSPTKEFTVLRSCSLWRGCHHLPMQETQGQQVGSLGQEDTWRRKWRPLQCSCRENPMNRAAWGTTAQVLATRWHRVPQSCLRTRLPDEVLRKSANILSF